MAREHIEDEKDSPGAGNFNIPFFDLHTALSEERAVYESLVIRHISGPRIQPQFGRSSDMK